VEVPLPTLVCLLYDNNPATQLLDSTVLVCIWSAGWQISPVIYKHGRIYGLKSPGYTISSIRADAVI
jgi:hypothetical protein